MSLEPKTTPQPTYPSRGVSRSTTISIPMKRYDQYGEITAERSDLQAILVELKAIRSLLEKQNGQS